MDEQTQAWMNHFRAVLNANQNGAKPDRGPYQDWPTLFAREHNDEWFVRGLWPAGRLIHLHAARKTGKSLMMLWIAVRLSMGFDPFTATAQPARRVAFWDYEMTEDDLLDRLTDMGFTPAHLTNLQYALRPQYRALDTRDGGKAFVDVVTKYGAELVIFDTITRVVQGDENSNDTFRRFYEFTVRPLRDAGIPSGRLDHEGYDGSHSRGASTKTDDVDVIWQLKRVDDGYKLINRGGRVPTVASEIVVRQLFDPLRYESRSGNAWPAGTAEKASELDAAGVPKEYGRGKATAMLREHGFTAGTNVVLSAALSFRRDPTYRLTHPI